jgi:hypothetical protein
MRQNYRFPRTGILLMLVALVGVVVAIEQARRISVGNLNASQGWSWTLIGLPVGWLLISGGIGYLVLRILRQSGISR